MRLRRVLPVGVQERPGQVRPAELLQIHRQEGDVQEHVTEAEPVVELQAVEDARAVVEAEDVGRQQVTLAVHDPPSFDALLEQRRTTVEVAQRQALDEAECVRRQE
jgi:hypothetical protein